MSLPEQNHSYSNAAFAQCTHALKPYVSVINQKKEDGLGAKTPPNGALVQRVCDDSASHNGNPEYCFERIGEEWQAIMHGGAENDDDIQSVIWQSARVILSNKKILNYTFLS